MQWKYRLTSNYCDICHLTPHGRKSGGGGGRGDMSPHFLEGGGHNMKCPPPPPPHPPPAHTHTLFGGLDDSKLKWIPFLHVLWRCRPVSCFCLSETQKGLWCTMGTPTLCLKSWAKMLSREQECQSPPSRLAADGKKNKTLVCPPQYPRHCDPMTMLWL